MIREIQCKSLLHYHSNPKAGNWDVNIYRGCGHRCVYCFARYSHAWLNEGNSDFFDDIFVKTNCVEILDRELSRRSWAGHPITFGGVTDSYQPLEASCRLMPDLIGVLKKHRNPLILFTKSSLILRDYDLIADLARVAPVTLGTSVITLDSQLASVLEPGASRPIDRLSAIAGLGREGCSTTLLMAPIIPLVTDSEEMMRELVSTAANLGMEKILAWHLKMRTGVSVPVNQLIKERFPDLASTFKRLFAGGVLAPGYRSWHSKILDRLMKRYPRIMALQERGCGRGVKDSARVENKADGPSQLSLFG